MSRVVAHAFSHESLIRATKMMTASPATIARLAVMHICGCHCLQKPKR
jgi:hypothetical protein